MQEIKVKKTILINNYDNTFFTYPLHLCLGPTCRSLCQVRDLLRIKKNIYTAMPSPFIRECGMKHHR